MALSCLGSTISNLVITIPAYLNNLQRQATLVPSQEWTSFKSSTSLLPPSLPMFSTRRLLMNVMSSSLILLESLCPGVQAQKQEKYDNLHMNTLLAFIIFVLKSPSCLLSTHCLGTCKTHSFFCHSNVHLNWLTMYSYITFCTFCTFTSWLYFLDPLSLL